MSPMQSRARWPCSRRRCGCCCTSCRPSIGRSAANLRRRRRLRQIVMARPDLPTGREWRTEDEDDVFGFRPLSSVQKSKSTVLQRQLLEAFGGGEAVLLAQFGHALAHAPLPFL